MKKLLLMLAMFLIAPTALAQEDFSNLNPTVKITSYQLLFNGNVLPVGSGSGTLISGDGLILSNHHVIFDEEAQEPLDAFEVCLTLDVQKEPVCRYTARLMDHDKDLDLALLQLDGADVFGNTVPTPLSHKDAFSSATPREGSRIQVIGYPGSGGRTVTITQGQISGFEEYNNAQYFKTDTDFDHGSSGGTALDENGNFIGVPTYIRSYAENVGFFLDLRDGRDWIRDAMSARSGTDGEKPVTVNLQAEGLLGVELKRFEQANESLKYTQTGYPHIGVELPAGWEFLEINRHSVFASQKSVSDPVGFSLFTLPYQFEVEAGYLEKLDEELQRIKETYPDYKKEETVFAGQTAYRITFTSYASKNTTYYIPYGYMMVGISYAVGLDEEEKQLKALEMALDSIRFTRPAIKDPRLPATYTHDNPPFEITNAGDWRFQKNDDRHNRALLAEAVEKGNFEGAINISYDRVAKSEKHLSAKDRLDDVSKALSGQKLIYRNDNVVLGGLEGFLYTYEYEGQKYQQIRKHMTIQLRHGDFEFSIDYDDLSDDFDRSLPVVEQMLDSFEFLGEATRSGEISSYGALGFTFSDIQHHRYARQINDLADKDIVTGTGAGRFEPEALATRADTLKIILESKNHLETERGSAKAVDFETFRGKQAVFGDVTFNDPRRLYLNYAADKGIIDSGRLFRPSDSINLVEALKLIMMTYEIPVWSGDTTPWWKKYMDKGFELQLIPYGMYDPGHRLTRAELVGLVHTVYYQAR